MMLDVIETEHQGPSESSELFDEALRGPKGKALREALVEAGIDRSMQWRYVQGSRKPRDGRDHLIERLAREITGRVIPAAGWFRDPAGRKPRRGRTHRSTGAQG